MCYLVGALFAVLRRKIYRYSLSLDDAEEIEQRNMLTAFCNGRYYGGGFYPVPSADPSDGWMDVLTVEPMGRLHTLPLLAKYKKGTHIHHKKVHVQKAKKITVRSSQRLCVNLDGELLHTNAISLSLWPQALLVAQKGTQAV